MNPALQQLASLIPQWGAELGFQQTGISDIDLSEAEQHLQRWLARGYQGDMDYMSAHGDMRSRPDKLHPGTLRIISARMDYLPANPDIPRNLAEPRRAYVSRYALGRDYHKVIRRRLRQLADKIENYARDHGIATGTARPLTDSAPLLEKAVAAKAGLGWIGKHTLLINRHAGSWFFLGEILTDLPLPVASETQDNRCGSCSACINICPTDAIVAPYELDARRCISYLTIESADAIPPALRPAIGNRVFGCDDCQLVCPWNRYASATREGDFSPRHDLDQAELLTLFAWTEEEFLERTAGSAIRRTGYRGWQRNLAVALGNAPADADIRRALKNRLADTTDPMVTEHLQWALEVQRGKAATAGD